MRKRSTSFVRASESSRAAALLALALALAGVAGAWEPAPASWPWWRGPACSGTSADTGERMADSLAEARLLWTSEEQIPGTYEGDARGPVPRLLARIPSGYASPVVAEGRVYLAYYVPNGPAYDKTVSDRHVAGGGMGREPWFTDADCVILCVDADTGKTLWKRVYVEEAFNLEAGFNKGGCQLTPCVAEGRAYAIGTCGRLHCVDARTGLPLWSGDLGIRARYQDDTKDGQREAAQVWGGRNDFGGCPMVAGGVAAVSDHWEYKGGPRTMGKGNGLVGFEAATGRRLWYVPGAGGRGMLGSTPLRWVHKGREYFIAAGEAGVTCIEPATGRVLWSLPDAGFDNAAAVDENRLWCQTGGLTCYRIEPSGARKEWTVAADPGFSSPALYRDHLYMLSKDGLLCLEAATGKTVAKVAQDHVVGSLAVADGRLFVQATGRGKFGMNVFKADPADLKPLGGQWRIPFANSTSPAVAGGRLYVRGRDRLHALDLRVR